MTDVKQPVGIRLSADDAAFLKEIAPKGNVSEGVRLLLENERMRKARPGRIEEALQRLHEVGADPATALAGMPRSVVSEEIGREAEYILATLLVGHLHERGQLELELLDRGFDLMDALLRQVLAPKAINSEAVRARAVQSREIMTAALALLSKTHPATR
jgi:hypothetical protein